MKVVPLFYTVLIQINCIPVELFVCRKDLQFGAISNHSDWSTFSEPKYNLSHIFFKTISIFRILNNCFIVCPKHTYRCDQKMVAATTVEGRNGVFQTSLDFEKYKALLNLSM